MDRYSTGTEPVQDESTRILVTTTTLYALSTIVLVSRCVARRIAHTTFWWDDWLLIPAFIGSTIMTVVAWPWMIKHGLGQHLYTAPADASLVWAKSLFMAEFAYTIAICSIKFSMLFFLWRIFNVSKIRPYLCALGITVALWGTAVLIITILQCSPVQAYWQRFDPSYHGSITCAVSDTNFFIGNAVPNIITDLALIMVPIPIIWELKLPRCQKYAVSGIFLLGFFVTGVSIARLVFLVRLNLTNADVTWTFINPTIWTSVEVSTAMITTCLPSLKPLLAKILPSQVKRWTSDSPTTESDEALSKRTSLLVPPPHSGIEQSMLQNWTYPSHHYALDGGAIVSREQQTECQRLGNELSMLERAYHRDMGFGRVGRTGSIAQGREYSGC